MSTIENGNVILDNAIEPRLAGSADCHTSARWFIQAMTILNAVQSASGVPE